MIVRHGTAKQTLTFAEAAAGQNPCYAAFYADCEHEVQRVDRGVRLSLAYNLVLKPETATPAAGKPAGSDELAESITSWVRTQPAEPLVFALEHHYTQRGLSPDLLKGADRQLAASVLSAAEKAGCLVHLAQVSRHLCYDADDGSYDWGRSRWQPRRREVRIGEKILDELRASDWTDLEGNKLPAGEIPFGVSAIVSSIPIADWKPTSEQYEGYTGNDGNTLDRWYHRSALVVWHRDHHFDVIARSGVTASAPLFTSMVAKLAKTPKKRLAEARTDCIRLARAIIARWPKSFKHRAYLLAREPSALEKFPDRVLKLRDRDTVALFLAKMAEADATRPLSSFVVAACEEFGWTAFGAELKQLLVYRPDLHLEVPIRDIEWLAAFCLDKTADADRSALARKLCALAVERFCKPGVTPVLAYRPEERREATVAEKSLPLLLQAVAAARAAEELERVIRFVAASPNKFGLDHCQVPTLKTLIPWARKHLGSVPPPLASWLASVRAQLEAAIARKPEPPADWARPAEVACRCEYCSRLQAFLADPDREIERIPAREDYRRHLIGTITQQRCDVKHALDRKGSPHALVLRKTTGSFERALKRYEADRRLLAALPAL